METVLSILESPLTALVVCLLLGAVAMSGKFSQAAANMLLGGVWIVGSLQIMKLTANQGRLMAGGILMLAGFCFIVSHWVKPEPKPKSEAKDRDSTTADSTRPPINPELAQQILAKLDELKKQQSSSPQPASPFLVSSGPILKGNNPKTGGFAVFPLIPPQPDPSLQIRYQIVNLMIFVGVLNQQSVPTIIQGYKMEIKTRQGGWRKLEKIDVINREVYLGLDSTHFRSVDANPFFDRVIQHHSFKAGDSALGWMVFKYPSDLGTVDKFKLRITVYDPSGKKVRTELRTEDIEDDVQGARLDYGRPLELRKP